MSRRKQSNPKSFKNLEENGGGEEDKPPGDEGDGKDSHSPIGSPVSSSNSESAQVPNSVAINLSKNRPTVDTNQRASSSKDRPNSKERPPSRNRTSSTFETTTPRKSDFKTSCLVDQIPSIPGPFVRLVPATSSDPIPNIVIPSHLFTTLVNIAAAGVLQALSSGLVPGFHMDQLGTDQPGIDHGHSEMNHHDVDHREMSDSETSHNEMNHSESDRELVRSEMDRVKRVETERSDLDQTELVKPDLNLSELEIQPFLRMRNQFVCAACGIRFKSLDNLQAHQTYYCTKRTGGPLIPVNSTTNTGSDGSHKTSSDDVNGNEVYRKRANGSGSSEKVSNNCNSTNGNSNTKTRSSTNPQQVQSFQCTICGYKGHTLRGMRTHVRMHTEELQGASEEDFIDHLDRSSLPVAAVVTNGNSAGPKKRTTSGVKRRKSVDHTQQHHHDDGNPQVTTTIHYLPNHDHQLTSSTPSAPSSSCLGFSSKSSPMETLSESEESVTHESNHAPHFNCFHCSYKSDYYGEIVKHMKLVHKNSPFNAILSRPLSRQRAPSVDLHESDHSGDDAVIVGKHFEPVTGSRTPDVEIEPKRRRTKERHSDTTVPARPSSNSSLSLPLMKRSPGSPSVIAEVSGKGTLQNGIPKSSVKVEFSSEGSSMKNSLKYCEECDISFNFVNSYLAHKQFYCSANK